MQLITPNNNTDNCPANATLYVGIGGTLRILPEGNEDGETANLIVSDGQFVDQVSVRRVLAAGTSADEIYAIF